MAGGVTSNRESNVTSHRARKDLTLGTRGARLIHTGTPDFSQNFNQKRLMILWSKNTKDWRRSIDRKVNMVLKTVLKL